MTQQTDASYKRDLRTPQTDAEFGTALAISRAVSAYALRAPRADQSLPKRYQCRDKALASLAN